MSLTSPERARWADQPRRPFRGGRGALAIMRSGPPVSDASRNARGLFRLQGLWVPRELVTRLDAAVLASGRTRTELVTLALGRLLDAMETRAELTAGRDVG